MVADNVEIITVYEEEEQARRLLLRSVHGKYLIRLLDKSEPDVEKIGKHGTLIRLNLRPSAELGSIVDVVRKWIVVPECRVSVQIDDGEEQFVGFESMKQALEDVLSREGTMTSTGKTPFGNTIKVAEWVGDGVRLAYAIEWSELFREWCFLERGRRMRRVASKELLGTCIEGVRVEEFSPGFANASLFAMANATGLSAPRTNVARSGLESTAESNRLIRRIYDGYCAHVTSEISDMQKNRNMSMTYAVGEAKYLLAPLLRFRERRPIDDEATRPESVPLLLEALAEVPVLVIEEGGVRSARSARSISAESSFWTSDCDFFRSVETLLRELPKSISLREIGTSLHLGQFNLPEGPLLCLDFQSDAFCEMVLEEREVAEVRVNREEKRVDVHWVKRADPPEWVYPARDWPSPSRRLESFLSESRLEASAITAFPMSNRVIVSGIIDEVAVEHASQVLVLPGTPFCDFLVEEVRKQVDSDRWWFDLFLVGFALRYEVGGERFAKQVLEQTLPQARQHLHLEALLGADKLVDIIRNNMPKTFRTSRWRREGETY